MLFIGEVEGDLFLTAFRFFIYQRPAGDGIHVRILGEDSADLAQDFLRISVVAVQDPDDLSPRFAESFVHRVGDPAVRLANHLKVGILCQDLKSFIGRPAVDDNMLYVGIVLVQHALNRVLN